jgi:hypothetical protein
LNDNYLISEDFLNKLNFSKKSKTPVSKPKPKAAVIKKKTSNNTIVSTSPESGAATPASPISGHNSRNKSPQKS